MSFFNTGWTSDPFIQARNHTILQSAPPRTRHAGERGRLRAMTITTLFLSLSASAAIFGADNRHTVTDQSPVIELARATAIAVLKTNYSVNGQTLTLATNPLTNLCKDEMLAGEPSLDYSCTGFLVGPDLLATAGHCVYAVNTPNQELKHETGLACDTFQWLFDFQQGKQANLNNLYHCKEIIYARQTEHAPFFDYALVRLDRPAFGRTPFKVNPAPVALGEAVAMIGYPFGTPVKYTDSARVTIDNPQRNSFLTSLDALEGNSGSPVFNAAHEVVGILVGGTPSANTYVSGTCERVNRCSEDGSRCNKPDTADEIKQLEGYQGVGSEVQRIAPIDDLLRH